MAAFTAGMNDDLNTPRAIAGVFSIVKAAEQLSKKDLLIGGVAELVVNTLDNLDSVLGIFYKPTGFEVVKEKKEEILSIDELTEEVRAMILQRQSAKESKNWEEADAIRDKLQVQGYIIVDQAQGELQVKRLA
mmetsp:Transcript_10906/g.17711  ORF Transcript_10906/g.17711 Transcript_10906/m.17711 type:complete len:133 (+) Transcript_10906:69-467(+)